MVEDREGPVEVDPADADAAGAPSRSDRARRYPPLLSILGALLIALVVMPSSLNLPQTNPTEVREFAPVPPEDDDESPPDGNISNLGLGSSAGLGSGQGDGAGGGTTLPTLPQGEGSQPGGLRCVAGRQTEDPLSPPCVAFFDGDNFCSTYQGVECDEVRILIYVDGSINDTNTSRGAEVRPERECFDLVNDPPKQEDQVWVRNARVWQDYFNQRYQTYGRYGHFFLCYSGADRTPESRRADAAEHFKRIEPFAAISLASFDGGGDAYLDSMAKRGVLNFGSFLGQEARFFQKYPKLIWGFLPSMEIQAQQYADVLCEKYVHKPVDHSAQFAGRQRRFGLVFTTDPGFASLRRFKDNVVSRFKACGGSVALERTFPTAGYSVDNSSTPDYAVQAMVDMRAAGVTTIIWPGGMEAKMSQAAAGVSYRPEWIIAGDGFTDSQYANRVQEPSVWENAAVVTPQTLVPELQRDEICFQAFRTVAPDWPNQDVSWACDLYTDLRQTFIGIQVAGPRLGPTSVDSGFHAIPPRPSNDLRLPSCYYLPGDYTCTKDYVIGHWDSDAEADQNGSGCYRVLHARRYGLGEVPPGNAAAGAAPSDPCLRFGSFRQLNLAPPDPGL